MVKDISQMSDHELLMELIADKRRQDKLRYVKYGIVAVILVAVIVELFIYVPKVLETINYYKGIIVEAEETMNMVNEVVSGIPEGLAQKINDLVESLNKFFGIIGG